MMNRKVIEQVVKNYLLEPSTFSKGHDCVAKDLAELLNNTEETADKMFKVEQRIRVEHDQHKKAIEVFTCELKDIQDECSHSSFSMFEESVDNGVYRVCLVCGRELKEFGSIV